MPAMRSRRRRWRQSLGQMNQFLARVHAVLKPLPIGSRRQFLCQPKGSLGGVSPRLALLQGRLDQVLRSAKDFRER